MTGAGTRVVTEEMERSRQQRGFWRQFWKQNQQGWNRIGCWGVEGIRVE